MKKDITNNKDIQKLVDRFYEKVKQDKQIGYFFLEVVKVDWEKHLETMYHFWENVLFYTGNYSGNPMQQHLSIDSKQAFTNKDFAQWIILFNETVDQLFEGRNAIAIKERAQNISTVMQIKMLK